MKPNYSDARQRALVKGYRSGLEDVVGEQLKKLDIAINYEVLQIKYTVPARTARYAPDFLLPNGIIIETKGRFEAADRQKHLLVKGEHKLLDIRFVFSRSATPIRKGSPTTYAMWCRTGGYTFADKLIPIEWLKEPLDPARLAAAQAWLKAPKK